MENAITQLFRLYKSKINSKELAPLFIGITIDGGKAESSSVINIIQAMGCKKGLIRGSNEEAKELKKNYFTKSKGVGSL